MKYLIRCMKICLFLLLFAVVENNFLTEPTATGITKPPTPRQNYISGEASYYSYECANLPMANGKIFDPEKRTCASWFYDFGTVLEVKSLDTGQSTEVIVTDRGPNKRLMKMGRIIDLSKRAFEDICDLRKGLTRVIVTVKAKPHRRDK